MTLAIAECSTLILNTQTQWPMGKRPHEFVMQHVGMELPRGHSPIHSLLQTLAQVPHTPGAVRGWDKMVGGNGSAHCPMDPTLDGGEPNQYIITVQPAHTLRAEGSDGLS